ncbi:MAG: efflux RND transporter periplasmic adaptor subunit, partial [Calditrichaceae bacterium]|nr:efflux RND transporter periplasmic adaptor subunit [Calditrichaceae bacterium]
MNKKYIFLPIGILLTGFLIMVLLINLKSETPKRQQLIQPKIVKSDIVKLKDMVSEIIGLGRLASSQPVTIYSEVTGILEAGTIPFLPAATFKKGDLLFKVDDRQTKLELNSLKSDLMNALASVLPEIKVDFPDEYQKFQKYFDDCDFTCKLSELPETNSQKIKLFLTRYNVYKLYYSVKNMEIRLEKHYYYAPFDGSVIAADLRKGSTVRAGSVIGHIINLDNLEVEVPVAANDIAWIDQSKTVRLTSTEIPGEWKGRIKRIGRNIDERTQTVPVFISIDKNGHDQLINGVFLKAVIPGHVVTNAVSVPNRAVYNESYVYLVKNGRLEFRQIEIARKQLDHVIVKTGIAEGDTLVTEVLQGIAPGMPAMAGLNGQ